MSKSQLIKQARKRHGKIYPTRRKRNLMECFTVIDGKLILWYNTGDNSTHIEKG